MTGRLQFNTFSTIFTSTRLVKVIVQFSVEEESRALPILLRHSPGMVLPDRTYVLSEEAVASLSNAGIGFTQLSRELAAPQLEEVVGERV